jgi:hypothetical protein
VEVGILTDVSVDFSQDLKELHGQYKFAVDIAAAKVKLSGKSKSALLLTGLMSSTFAGGTVQSGTTRGIVGETATIPGTPYQITVANSATWVTDLGVMNFTQGIHLARVASAPATGQYSVAAGIYTFAAADTTQKVGISYEYTTTAGKTFSLSNALMGAGTPFILKQHNTYRSKGLGWMFNAVYIPKLAFALKAEAFTEVDVDFMMSADDNAVVMSQYQFE